MVAEDKYEFQRTSNVRTSEPVGYRDEEEEGVKGGFELGSKWPFAGRGSSAPPLSWKYRAKC